MFRKNMFGGGISVLMVCLAAAFIMDISPTFGALENSPKLDKGRFEPGSMPDMGILSPFSSENKIGVADPLAEENKEGISASLPEDIEIIEVNCHLNNGANDWLWGITADPYANVIIEKNAVPIATVSSDIDGNWEIDVPIEITPGDFFIISVDEGQFPVTLYIPDPMTSNADSQKDEIWGHIEGWYTQPIYVEPNWDSSVIEVTTDESGYFLLSYIDVPFGGSGNIHFTNLYHYTELNYYQYFRTQDLVMDIHYDHDWIEGPYEAGHTITLEVYDSADTLKASATLSTGPISAWNGVSGFTTLPDGVSVIWVPEPPDLVPGDRIYGEVDDGTTYNADVKIGPITAETNLASDQVTGTIDAAWLDPLTPVKVSCEIWEETGPNIVTSVNPNGVDTYECNFQSTGYDLQPGAPLMVAYFDPFGHKIIGDFHPDAPYLTINKWYTGDGSPGVGGNAAFYVSYSNQGELPAEDVTIIDTFVGMTYLNDTSGILHTIDNDQVTWSVGQVNPGDRISFIVFAEVTASEDTSISNTVEINTSNPFDMGEPWEKTSTWEGTVAENDTHLSVSKSTWTEHPAPGGEFVYLIDVCNSGGTGSSTISLSDTLPNQTSLISWWSEESGWIETSSSAEMLELNNPCISPGTCTEVYVRVKVDETATPGDELINVVEIIADNDMETGDNFAQVQHAVGVPYTDLAIWQVGQTGSFVPGGLYEYEITFRNIGNQPVSGPIKIIATLPPKTSLIVWDSWGWAPVSLKSISGSTIIWQVDALEPGIESTIGMTMLIDPETSPGTVLTHIAEIISLTDENQENNFSILELNMECEDNIIYLPLVMQ